MSDEDTVQMEGAGPAAADGSLRSDEMLSSPSVSLSLIYKHRGSQLTGDNKKSISKDLFPHSFDSQFDPMPFPVFLQLCEILSALVRHPALINFILVITNSTSHLSIA